MSKRRIIIALSIFFLVVLTRSLGVFYGVFDPLFYPIRGIDISHHQNHIDWNLLATGDTQFVYMKATEGNDWLDNKFLHNWKESKNVNIPRGAYLFMTFCSPAQEQADFFIKNVDADQNDLPPVIDIEHRDCKDECCHNLPPNTEIHNRIQIIKDALQKRYKKEPIIYTTPIFYWEHLRELEHSRYWVASWGIWPFWRPDWLVWQTTAGEWSWSNRNVKGFSGNVDRNVLRVPVSELINK